MNVAVNAFLRAPGHRDKYPSAGEGSERMIIFV